MSKLQVVKEIHRSARKNFPRRHTQMRGIDETFQIDLVEMIPYANQNQQFKYILTIIDIFSKYAWAYPLKSKKGKEVAREMERVFKSGRIPKNIHSDMGKEFYNSEFNRLMNKYNINLYSTFSSKKASIIERFNRTLKSKMWQKLHLQGSYKWLKILKPLLDEYNNTKHSKIKMKPRDVTKDNEQELLDTVYNDRNVIRSKPKYKIGDYVRISKYKNVFEKSYIPNWTTEVFTISKIQYTTPITYILKDYENNEIKGAFYELELQKAKYPDVYLIEKIVRKVGDRLYIKWLGMNEYHNSWINKNDVL